MVGLRALVVLFLVVLSVPAAAAHAAAPARPTAGWYGVDILGTNLILRADGSQVPLRPPAGQVATMAAGVPSGWVLYMKEPESARAALWFVPLAGGAGQRISPVSGNWKLSHDGTRLVIAGVGDSPAELRTVLLVDLPSLRVVARTEVNTDSNGLNAVGITPDGVVLRESWLENTPTGAAIWDPRTGDVRWARERLWALGTTADGRLLARWSLGSWRSRRSCISLAPVTGSFRRPRYCAGVPRSVIDGYISPDGSVAHLMFNVTEFEYQWGWCAPRTCCAAGGGTPPCPRGRGPAGVLGHRPHGHLHGRLPQRVPVQRVRPVRPVRPAEPRPRADRPAGRRPVRPTRRPIIIDSLTCDDVVARAGARGGLRVARRAPGRPRAGGAAGRARPARARRRAVARP
ncbi:hypothetical protein ACFQX7_33735 [Luedemannella flava]